MKRLRLWIMVGLLFPWTAVADDKPQPPAKADPLPRFARVRLGSTRFQHGAPVTSIQFLPGGQAIASYGQDRHIRIWERDAGRELRAIPVPPKWGLAPDGRSLVLLQDHEPPQIVDLVGEKESRKLEGMLPREEIAALALAPDGETLAIAGTTPSTRRAGIIRLWDVGTGKERRGLAPPRAKKDGEAEEVDSFQPHAIYFSPDGKTLAVLGSKDKQGTTLRLWDVSTGKERSVPAGQNHVSRQVVFTPDSKMLLGISIPADRDAARLGVWDVANGKKVRELGKFDGCSPFMLLSPDGKTVAVLEAQAFTMQLWDVVNGKQLPQPVLGANNILFGLAFAPDSRTLALLYDDIDTSMVLWDLAAQKELRQLKAPPGASVQDFPSPAMPELGMNVAFSPDGKEVAAGLGAAVYRWDAATGKPLSPNGTPPLGEITKLALTPDGKQVVTAHADQTVRLWDAATGKEVRQVTPPAGLEVPLASQVALSPDGRILAVGWFDGTIQLSDMATGKELRLLSGHTGVVTSLAFAPNGKTLASADNSGEVIWWERETGHVRRRFLQAPPPSDPGKAPPPRASGQPRVAFAADGRALAALTIDGTNYRVRVWELASGELRRDMPIKTEPLEDRETTPQEEMGDATCVKFSPDGKALVWVAGRQVRFWDLARAKEIRALDLAGELVEEVEFSPDGRFLAGAGRRGTVRLWEAATGVLRATLPGHRGSVAGLAFSADGRTLASGGSDSSILLWDVSAALDLPEAKNETRDRWDGLADRDAKRAYEAVCRMAATPEQTVPWLRERLQPAQAVDLQRLERLLADLESDRFPVRRRATVELEKMGELAEASVRRRLAEKPPLDVSQRLDKVLEKLTAPVAEPEKLRALRAVEVLEQIGTAEAADVLRRLSKGAPEARLTQEATEALQRLAKRAALPR